MISPEERKYLYWLGSKVWTGQGCVVEIGPWLGGSTVCLAAGMRDSCQDASMQLKVFDNFIWRDFMAERAQLPLDSGASFKEYFLENTANYQDIVECNARALPDETITGDFESKNKRFNESESVPIFDGVGGRTVEILFIDGAKSWRGMRHMLRTLSSSLLPGATLFVCQDFKYWGTYWVPAMLMRLGTYLTPVHNVTDATTVTFKLVRPIPDHVLDALEDHVSLLHTMNTLNDLERAAQLLSDAGDKIGAHTVALSKVSFLAHQEKMQEAASAFAEIVKDWPTAVSTAQLERALSYLTQEKKQQAHYPLRLRSARFLRRLKSELRRLLKLLYVRLAN